MSDQGFGLIQGEDGHEYFMHRSSGNTRGFGKCTRTPRKAGGARKAGSA
jgi:cold shock CspA family protein